MHLVGGDFVGHQSQTHRTLDQRRSAHADGGIARGDNHVGQPAIDALPANERPETTDTVGIQPEI